MLRGTSYEYWISLTYDLMSEPPFSMYFLNSERLLLLTSFTMVLIMSPMISLEYILDLSSCSSESELPVMLVTMLLISIDSA